MLLLRCWVSLVPLESALQDVLLLSVTRFLGTEAKVLPVPYGLQENFRVLFRLSYILFFITYPNTVI